MTDAQLLTIVAAIRHYRGSSLPAVCPDDLAHAESFIRTVQASITPDAKPAPDPWELVRELVGVSLDLMTTGRFDEATNFDAYDAANTAKVAIARAEAALKEAGK